MPLKGIVLAGGKSSRFAGDKAMALIDGMPMVQKATGLIRALGLEPILLAHPSRDYSSLGCRVEHDVIPSLGPLGGIYTACMLFQGDYFMVLTCDMPLLTPEVLEILVRRHERGAQATIFDGGPKWLQPFPGIYDSSLAGLAREHLEKGELSMQMFLQAIPAKTILGAQSQAALFLDVDQPCDLKAVGECEDFKSLRRLQGRGQKHRDNLPASI